MKPGSPEFHGEVISSGLRSMVLDRQITLPEALSYQESVQSSMQIAVRGFADYLKTQLETRGKKPEIHLIDRVTEEYLQDIQSPVMEAQ